MEKAHLYRNRILLLTLVIVFCIASTYAQTEKHLLPTEIKEQTIITEPATLQKGFLRSGFIFSHSFTEKIFNENNEKISPFGSISALTRSIALHANYGLTDRLQINLRIPYKSDKMSSSSIQEWPGEDTIVLYNWQQDAIGLSDIELGVYYQVLAEKQQRPSITLRATYRFNTGEKNPTNVRDQNNYDAPPGTGEPRLSLDVHFRKVIYPYSFTFTTEYIYYFGGNKVFIPGENKLSFRTGNIISLSGSANFHVNEWIALVNDIKYFYGGEDKVEGVTILSKRWAFIYHPYLYFQIKRFRLAQSVEIPVKGCAYTADPQYILILQYQF
ncbi:MAG: hypothetical protein JSV22_07280 [Bacteroidales bacterium]|nr:MAG: hypothetical protein JSV22_07280 [Bacteroidales bacterium]